MEVPGDLLTHNRLLKVLNLSNNNINVVPLELESVADLDLTNNPLSSIFPTFRTDKRKVSNNNDQPKQVYVHDMKL